MNSKPIQLKGRAVSSNAVGRFELETREIVDDGWRSIDEGLPPIKTEVFAVLK